MRDLNAVFDALGRSTFRRRFRLGHKERAYLAGRGVATVLAHAADLVARGLAPAEPGNDGKQTPYRGPPVFGLTRSRTMSCTPSAVGSRSRMLPIALILLAATSLIHHVHNAEFFGDYPSMPAWLSPGAVYAAWPVAAAVGIAGYALLRAGYRAIGTLLIVAYGCYGLDGLVHYVIAPLSAHSLAMHFTIVLEAAAGGLLLGVIARSRYG